MAEKRRCSALLADGRIGFGCSQNQAVLAARVQDQEKSGAIRSRRVDPTFFRPYPVTAAAAYACGAWPGNRTGDGL